MGVSLEERSDVRFDSQRRHGFISIVHALPSVVHRARVTWIDVIFDVFVDELVSELRHAAVGRFARVRERRGEPDELED